MGKQISLRAIVAGVGALALTCSLSFAQVQRQVSAPRHSQLPIQTRQQRELPLQGGRNFRDLGGYRTVDGRTVRWRVLYRSGSMQGLTLSDYTYLERRGIRVVCDLRDNAERAAGPVKWPRRRAPRILVDDYSIDHGLISPSGEMAGWTPAQARAAMVSNYPRILRNYNGQYRRLFRELLAHHVPLAFNCTAGKDRTGIAAALILTALGVPRETIIEDYLLSNNHLDSDELLRSPSHGSSAGFWATLSPGVIRAFVVVERQYIEAAMNVLDKHSGGPDGYLHDELGLSQSDLIRLRQLYLEP